MSKVTVKIRLDILLPVVVIPLTLSLAALSATFTVLMLSCLLSLLIIFYRLWRKKSEKPRTQFFLAWSLMSIAWGFFIFEVSVVSFREILLWENLLLVTVGALMINNILNLKHSSSLIHRPPRQHLYNQNRNFESNNIHVPVEGTRKEKSFPSSLEEMTAETVLASEITWLDSRPVIDGKLSTWCSICQIKKPPRSSHCETCNACVYQRDHHNIWLDKCVALNNHKTYLVMLMQLIFCGFYGCQLTMTTICTPEIYLDWFLIPNDCRFLYVDFWTAISFVTVIYTLLASCVLTVVFLRQCLFISQNVTRHEFNIASKQGWIRKGVWVQNNLHNQGFLINWINFLLVGKLYENKEKMSV